MELKPGLEGVPVAETKISMVDGQNGVLVFRGHNVEEIVKNHTYEEVVYLLWNSRYPTSEELKNFSQLLKEHRELPKYLKDLIDLLPKEKAAMEVIRTVVSAMVLPGNPWPPTQQQALAIFAKIPTIVTYFHRTKAGEAPIEPSDELGYAANYLYMLHGEKPSEAHVKALEAYLMLSIDHGMNASTFTARVVTSTQENILGAITAAIAALEGPLHGGAPSEVGDMLAEIGSIENAEPWLRNKLENNERLMGFGHRVYKTYDPRAMTLKEVTRSFANDDNPIFKLAHGVEDVALKLLEEYKPGRKLYTNIEFWTACVLKTVGLPSSIYTATFCMSRVAGWSANIIEQSENNRLIRPSSIYVGPMPK